MKIIKDLRVLKAIGRKYKIEFDKDYKYILSDNYSLTKDYEYNGKIYKIKFFDGCFCPYLISE